MTGEPALDPIPALRGYHIPRERAGTFLNTHAGKQARQIRRGLAFATFATFHHMPGAMW